MKLVNKSGKVRKFKLWILPGQPAKEYVVEPNGVCEVPDGYCVAAGRRKSAIEQKAPGLVPYVESEAPKPEPEVSNEEPVKPPRRSRKKSK